MDMSKWRKVENPQEILHIIEKLEVQLGQFSLWQRPNFENQLKFKAESLEANFACQRLSLESPCGDFRFRDDEEVYFFCHTEKIYFKANLLKNSHHQIYLSMPKWCLAAENRLSYRHVFNQQSKSYGLLEKVEGGEHFHSFKKELHDLSAKGFSFIIGPWELNHFYQGDRLSLRTVVDDELAPEIEGEIKYLKRFHDYKENRDYFRVGVIFPNHAV